MLHNVLHISLFKNLDNTDVFLRVSDQFISCGFGTFWHFMEFGGSSGYLVRPSTNKDGSIKA